MDDLETVADRLAFRSEDLAYLVPCLNVTLYWAGPPFEHHKGIIEFYQHAIALIRPRIKFFRTETMTAARALKKDSLNLVSFWFESASRRDIYMLYLESGNSPDEPSDSAFALNATLRMGFVRLILPVSFIHDSVTPFIDVVKRAGDSLQYEFGQGGLGLNFNHMTKYNRKALEAMSSLSSRYPGLDMSHPFITQFVVGNGIKCIDWLTFLNARQIEVLGGMARLRAAFNQDVVIHPLRNGVMIQAGPLPEFGDVNRRQTLPLYHQVGRALAPVRAKDHPAIFGPNGIGDKEATERWLARFDS